MFDLKICGVMNAVMGYLNLLFWFFGAGDIFAIVGLVGIFASGLCYYVIKKGDKSDALY